MFSLIQIARAGNGHTLGHGVEASLELEFSAERLRNQLSTGPHVICSSESFLDGN